MNKARLVYVLAAALVLALVFGIYQKIRADKQERIAIESTKKAEAAKLLLEKTQREMAAQQAFTKGSIAELLKQLEASKKVRKRKK